MAVWLAPQTKGERGSPRIEADRTDCPSQGLSSAHLSFPTANNFLGLQCRALRAEAGSITEQSVRSVSIRLIRVHPSTVGPALLRRTEWPALRPRAEWPARRRGVLALCPMVRAHSKTDSARATPSL